MRADGGSDHDPHELHTVVPTEMGDLHAILRVPDEAPLPGLVLVDGSGDGDRNGWGERPRLLGDAGAVVLRHDKPGCGGSPGDWMAQTLHDRARETLDAVRVLRGRPARASAAAYARLLPDDPRSGIAVLPGADHGLRVAVADELERGGDLAAGYVALVAGFLAAQRR